MVTSGTVNSSLEKFLSDMGDYSSRIESLSRSWKGASHDKLEEQATSFASRFKDSLENHFNSFAEACDLYEKYEELKEEIEELETKKNDHYSSWKSAESNDDSVSAAYHRKMYNHYANKIEDKEEEKKELKEKINGLLDNVTALADSRAASKKAAAAAAKKKAEEEGKNPNIVYAKGVNKDKFFISSKNGYVFPLEKGVYAPVTSSVGHRTPPKSGATSNHQGTDIGIPTGTNVHSLCDGKVVATGAYGGYGQRVEIKQSDGSTVLYGHLSDSNYFNVGDEVKAGDIIALSGNTGNTTGPHLHLEIHDEDGNLVDSEEIFDDNGNWPGGN